MALPTLGKKILSSGDREGRGPPLAAAVVAERHRRSNTEELTLSRRSTTHVPSEIADDRHDGGGCRLESAKRLESPNAGHHRRTVAGARMETSPAGRPVRRLESPFFNDIILKEPV